MCSYSPIGAGAEEQERRGSPRAGAVDGHEGEREIGALEVGAEGTGVLGPADEQLDSLLSTSAALLHLDLRKSPQERSAEASVGNLHGRDAV